MGVYIPNMEMPDSCHVCVAGYGGCCYVAPPESDGVCPDSGRADFCPLVPVPPHGRLIDADVAEVISFSDEDAKGDFCDGILFAADWISEQPTIIEAEEGEDGSD